MASGTKFMKEISDQFLICKICLEPFKEPKTLSCLHSFCVSCLQKQADTSNSPTRFYSRFITCPLCRKKTEIPSGGIRRLPDNFLVCNLTDVVNKRQSSKVSPCEICHPAKTKSNDACSKCLDCGKLLCKSCVEQHLVTKVTQKHSLIDIQGETDIECKSHPEETVRFYCEPCEACICVVCAFQDHRDHDVCSFSDGFSKYKEKLDVLLTQGQQRMSDVDSTIKLIDKYQKVIKETRENIRDLAISYISKVRQTEKALLKKVDDIVGDHMMDFLDNRNWLQENLDNLNSTCNLTKIIMKDSGVEMLLLKQEIQSKMSTLLEPNIPNIPNDLPSQIKFIPGDVKLGHISTSEKDIIEQNGFADVKIDTNFQHTQTDNCHQKELCDGTTTMFSDMANEFKDETVQTTQLTMASRETCTDTRECRDQGVSVYLHDLRTKGTITDKQNVRSTKCQTEKPCTFDQETNTARLILPSVDVMVNTPVVNQGVSTVSKCLQVQARTASKLTNTQTFPEVSPDNAWQLRQHSDTVKADRPRNWVHSRKIQTDVSAICYDGDNFLTDMLKGAIVPEANGTSSGTPGPEMKDAQVNTTFNVRIVPEMTEKSTSPEFIAKKDQACVAYPSLKSSDTQTQRIRSRDMAVVTDYSGQRNKATSTLKPLSVDSHTQMIPVTQEHKVTWTDKVSTCERATCPIMCLETTERSTSTVAVQQGEIGTQVTPTRKIRATNTPVIGQQDKNSQTKLEETSITASVSDLQTSDILSCSLPNLSGDSLLKHPKTHLETSSIATDTCDLNSSTLNTSFMSSVSASTDTIHVTTSEKETSMPHVYLVDQWTFTPQPQLINTGFSPPRPATIDSTTSTNPVITIDSSTYTEIVTQRDTATETFISVSDNETITERFLVADAQTGIDLIMENAETSTEAVHLQDAGSCANYSEMCDSVFYTTEATAGSMLSSLGVQTDFSSVECAICEHQFQFSEENPPLLTHDVGTMALSVTSYPSNYEESGTQTVPARLFDKSIGTSLDLEDEERKLTMEHHDASTSTESLPYIGLLSELDVDDFVVVPEAHFDLVSLYSTDDEYDVLMVDNETSTENYPLVEVATQTPFIVLSPDSNPTSPFSFDESRQLVSIGVNTASKLTFEKETCTPMRHLFSKGTMTFFISKMDKSTSTFSYTRQIAESRFGGCVARIPLPKVPVEDKHTMTSTVEFRDIASATDSSLVDGNITKCISKLKNVSEKLNSPSPRQSSENIFFGKTFAGKQSDSSDQSSGALNESMTSSKENKSMSASLNDKPETERKKHIQKLLAETQAILDNKEQKKTLDSKTTKTTVESQQKQTIDKAETSRKGPSISKGVEQGASLKCPLPDNIPKPCVQKQDLHLPIVTWESTTEVSITKLTTTQPQLTQSRTQGLTSESTYVRKAQPITTLKARSGDKNSFESHSLPRQYSVDYPPAVRMGNQLAIPTRLPLLRYNSAPGRIATVPTQTLQDMQKSRYSPPSRTSPQRGASPSKIPVKNVSEISTTEAAAAPKAIPRPPLPSISEMRALSSCSDTSTSSYVSAESVDSATPSLTLSTVSTSSGNQADTGTLTRSSCDTSSTGSAEGGSKNSKKASSKNFMQRLLSKKKKEPEVVEKPVEKPVSPENMPGAKYRVKQTPPDSPKVPAAPRKPRPFVYVRQRIFSIQHDNEDDMKSKKSKEKEKCKKVEMENTKKNGKKSKGTSSSSS